MDFGTGVWIVHAVVVVIIALMFLRRVYMQRWWPRRLKNSNASATAAGTAS